MDTRLHFLQCGHLHLASKEKAGLRLLRTTLAVLQPFFVVEGSSLSEKRLEKRTSLDFGNTSRFIKYVLAFVRKLFKLKVKNHGLF